MDNPAEFPSVCLGDPGHPASAPGMTLRDWFAGQALSHDEQRIATEMGIDRARNPHNDSYKPRIRSRYEIIAKLNYEYADAMLLARQQEKG